MDTSYYLLMRNVTVVNQTNQKGIALIQVLLLSAILAMMALQFTLSSRQQVQQASAFKDKIAAELELRTLESRVLMALLSLPLYGPYMDLQKDDPIGKVWNFYGKPFAVGDNAEVSIQDVNGQISVFGYGLSNSQPLNQLLLNLGKSESEAKAIIENLANWQGYGSSFGKTLSSKVVRNNYFVSKTELKHIDGINDELYLQLAPLVTTLQVTSFNPLVAPLPVMKTAMPANMALEFNGLRERGAALMKRYIELNPGYDDDVINLSVGDRFEVHLEVKKNGAVAKRSVIWYIRPLERIPVAWLQ